MTLPRWFALPLAAALLAGCDTPLSTLAPAGPVAQAISWIWWMMLAGAGLLTVLVLALVWAGFRAPARQPGERFWTHGMGVGFSLAILTLVVGAGIWTGERLQPHAGPEVVTVEAVSRQWAWSFRQPGPDGAPVATEGVLYIPARRPVDVRISSEDVIHSFWAPRLAGKMDAIPGRVNVLRIEASAPGHYEGLSAEFSGAGYGQMRFAVIAYAPDAPPEFADIPAADPATDGAAE